MATGPHLNEFLRNYVQRNLGKAGQISLDNLQKEIERFEKDKNTKNHLKTSIQVLYKEFQFLQKEIESDINRLKQYNLKKQDIYFLKQKAIDYFQILLKKLEALMSIF